jgi:ribosomal protein L37AE/L43A
MGEAKRRKLAGEPPRDHGGPYTCPNCGHAATFLRNDAKRYGCPKCGVTTVAGAAVELHERGTDTIVFLQVGKAGELTPEALKKSVTSYAKALRKLGPLPPVELAMLGYDDDPREIFEIPEASPHFSYWRVA